MIKQIIENAFKSWQECGGIIFNNQSDKLSLASKQSLLSLVRDEINQEHAVLMYYKGMSAKYYQESDKTDEVTYESFQILNSCRNVVRDKKKRIKQLSRIAKELKMSMK